MPRLEEYWNECGIDHKTMVNLRNEAIHTALSVSPAMAKAAYEVVRKALEEFERKWVGLLSMSTPTYQPWNVSWEEICQACGVNFLPKLA